MKKLLSTIMIVAMLMSTLAGCKGNTSNATPGNSDAAVGTAKEPVVVEFWHVYSENFGAPVIREMVDAFNAQHSDIKVVETYNPNMYPGLMQNLQAEVASGSTPDIVMIGYNYLKYFAANFQYTQPQEIVEKYFPEDKDYLNTTFLPNILSLAQVDGKQIGIPFSISTPVIYYNADLFKDAGLDPETPPSTWNEVRAAAKKITETTGEYGFYMQEYADNWAVQGMLEGNGARMLSDDGTKATFASAEAAEAYQLLTDMVLVDKSALHITADEGIQAFVNGKVGMLCGSSAKIGTVKSGASFDLRGAKFPVFDGKEMRIPAGGNFMPIMSQTEEKQKAAWEFMKFVMQPEWLAKWSINTGYLPPRQDVADDPNGLQAEIAKNQLLGVAFEEMAGTYSWVSYPGDVGVQAEKMLADTRDKILSGAVTPAAALKETEEQINKLLG